MNQLIRQIVGILSAISPGYSDQNHGALADAAFHGMFYTHFGTADTLYQEAHLNPIAIILYDSVISYDIVFR